MNTGIQPIKILIADDHEIFRDGFRSLLQNETAFLLVAEASNGQNLINLARLNDPDVILMDIKMPGMNGIEATKILSKQYPRAAVIALTMCNEEHLIADMLAAGAKGYVLKDASKSEVIDAIKTVNKNGNYYCRSTTSKLTRLIANNEYNPDTNERKVPLSPRETQILVMICQQRSNKEISKKLNISVRTVEGFRTNLLIKTGSMNIAGMVLFAIRRGIFCP